MHLLIDILGVTNELSQALQRKDQDILNAMKLVQISKQQLQMMRDNGWNFLLEEVSHFCNVFEVDVPVMSSTFKARRRSKRRNMMQQIYIIIEWNSFILSLICNFKS
ncbi:hypothetical protein MA16_Dca005508 [Dendrobium catenatum]|uniref:Uncharacterized protein n=1 Tax=Dendrobium catenatum TaxID=906689 RepID=A0A2I0X3L7_9ASPA|nr:hypothetical protein MA16_Dca005508 [Dendrobium catenatum]